MTLPIAGAAGARLLPARARAYLNVRDASVAVVVGALGVAAASFIPDPTTRVVAWVVIAGFVASTLVIELPVLNRLHVRTTSYTVSADYVYIARGWLLRRSLLISTTKVLNVEIVQGPLLRRFGLVTMRIASVIEHENLGPLEPAEAERLRGIILDSQGEPDRGR